MNKAAWGVVLALLLGAPQEDLGKIVSGVEKPKKLSKKITADQAKAIATIVGLQPNEVETGVTVLEGWAMIPEEPEKGRVLGAVVTAKGPKGTIKIGVAIAADVDKIVAIKVLENKDEKAAESALFADQFLGFEWSPEALRKSPADQKAAIEKGKTNKEVAALVEFSAQMRRVGLLWETAVTANDKADKTGASKALEEMAKIYDALNKKVGDLASLNARQRGDMTAGLTNGSKSARDLAAKADGSDASKKMAGEIAANSCNKCHAWSRMRNRNARNSNGVGNGFFSPELDVLYPAEGTKELYDAMSKQIRKAILQLRDAK